MTSERDRGLKWPDRTEILDELDWDSVSLSAVDAMQPRELAALLREMPAPFLASFTGLLGMRGPAAKVSAPLASRIAERIRQSKGWDHVSRLLTPMAPFFHEPLSWRNIEPGSPTPGLEDPQEARRRVAWSRALLDEPISMSEPGVDDDVRAVRQALQTAAQLLRRSPSMEAALLAEVVISSPVPAVGLAFLASLDPEAARAHAALAERFPDMPASCRRLSQFETSYHAGRLDPRDLEVADASQATCATEQTEALSGLPDNAGLEQRSSEEQALLRAGELLAKAPALAENLRQAGDSVSKGQAPADAQLSSTLHSWAQDVAALLGESHQSLPSLIEELEAEAARLQEELKRRAAEQAQAEAAKAAQTARREELIQIRQAASSLSGQGLDHLARDLLAAKGFESIQDVEAEVNRLSSNEATELTSDQTDAADDPNVDGSRLAEARDEDQLTAVGAGEPESMPATESTSDEAFPSLGLDASQATHEETQAVEDVAPLGAAEAEAAEREVVVGSNATATAPCDDRDRVVDLPVQDVSVDPWTGTPPLVATLIEQGRERLAYLMSLNGTTGARQSALYSFCSAFGLRPDVAQVHLTDIVEAAGTPDTVGREESRVLLSAGIRLALGLGYMPIALEPLREKADLDGHPANALVTAAIRLAMRGYKRPGSLSGEQDVPSQWSAIARQADAALNDLRNARVSFHRATKIAHYLARDTQPVGQCLTALMEIARAHAQGESAPEDRWQSVETVARQLRNDNSIDRLINETYRAVSSPQQALTPIVAGARDKLLSLIRAVAEVIQAGLELRQEQSAPGSEHSEGVKEFAATRAQFEAFEVASVGEAALHRLGDWIMSEEPERLAATSLEEVLDRELTPLFELPRAADGRRVRNPIDDEILSLIEPRPLVEVVDGYLAVGNIRAAEALLAAESTVATEVEESLQQARREHERKRSEVLSQAESLISRLRTLEDDDRARELAMHLERLRPMKPGRFDLAVAPIEALVRRAAASLDRKRDGLTARANQLESKTDSERIQALVESGEEVLASEYLALCESGQELPVFAPPPKDDLAVFFPRLVELAATAGPTGEIAQVVRADLGHAGTPSHRLLREGLMAWSKLSTQKQGVGVGETVAPILRMVGLVPETTNWNREITRQKRAGYAAWTVKARPQELAYVPSYGTRANGTYDVTVVWDESTPQRLIDLVDDDRRNKANLILYMGALTAKQRLELRRIGGRSGPDVTPLVIDTTVIAWLSTLEEPSWRATQRVTLPFTTANPYIPFGEVPDEMFVGRVEERSQIEDPTGSMFVYGGRQLGKSALLRRVERGVMRTGVTSDGEPPSRVAIYFDLKSSSIGEGHEPSRLWSALQPRLSDVGVLDAKRKSWSTDAIIDGIATWLKDDESRTMLLLLDEADNFLTYDATDRGATGLGGFPTLQRLKGLMERSDRRFKPVFAGLHQVQRFHGLPNTPVVHGGSDILIGPLKDKDARDLVRDPLYALGYQFENDETMWRLLLHTNYQASLIQIVCDSLVRHIRTTATAGHDGRIVITSRHIDEVYAKREVRELIADRFQWTINLDPRYRVIAQVVALRSLDAQPGESFRPSDLHDDCEFYWGEGFSRRSLSSSEFKRYLNEMTGLGVLHRQDGGYSLRSPSILGLLGSRADLEEQLIEASETLVLANPYNPAVNRRLLAQPQQRSPLPDADLARLLDHSETADRIIAVVGTTALGIDRVAEALQIAANDKPVDCVTTTPEELAALQRVTSDRHYVIDTTDWELKLDVLRAVVGRIRTAATTGLTLIVTAAQAEAVRSALPDLAQLELKRWSAEGLQQLLKETPFATPAHTAELLRVTGGWPLFVERALTLVDTRTREETLETIGRELGERVVAHQLVASADVPTEMLATWVAWFPPGEACSLSDLEAAEITPDLDSLLSQLEVRDAVEETPDGVQLNAVLAGALLVD